MMKKTPEETKNQKEVRENKKALLIAYEKSLGIVTETCRSVGISRVTFYNYMKADPKFKKAIDDLGEMQIDYVEHSLLKKIKDGDTTAIIFYLKTKGRARGYDERIGIDFTKQIEIVKHKELADI